MEPHKLLSEERLRTSEREAPGMAGQALGPDDCSRQQ